MNIKHKPLFVPNDGSDPFVNCKLDRKKYAEVLTTMVTTYSDGFVLAINNKWGTGKSTFLEMWKQQLKNEGFQTLYFNAWENDFQPEVMVALLAELKELQDKGKSNFNSLVKSGATFLNKATPIITKGIISKAVGDKAVGELVEVVTELTAGELKKQIDSFTDAKRGVVDFRESLEKYVEKVNNDKPVVFIIDELDRCRPNYSVSVLEEIKHLFSVPGIVFVLSIDKVQLGHAIRGVYGSEQIDSDEYLRRFIDIEYALPDPPTDLFVDYLYDYFDFKNFFSNEFRLKHPSLNDDKHILLAFAKTLFEKSKLTLRQQSGIMAQSRLATKSFELNSYAIPNLLIFLVYCRDQQKTFYNNITSKSFTHQALVDKYEEIIINLTNNIFSTKERQSFIWIMATLLDSYNASLQYEDRIKLITIDESKNKSLSLKSTLDNSLDYKELIYLLEINQNRRTGATVSIDHLLLKIDLLSPFLEGI